MGIGRPKSTSLDAIRKRWDGTVKLRNQVTWRYLGPLREKPTAWHQVLIPGATLPPVEQAALDIDALLELIARIEAQLFDQTREAEMYREVVAIVGHDSGYDCLT